MAQLTKRFETANVAPAQSRELIPAGKYNVQIVASEFKTPKSGVGQMLKLEFDILDGEHQGRKIWTNLNLENPNPKAVEMAEEALRDICLAIGRQGCSDSEELHLKPMSATIVVKEAAGQYGPSNEIKYYKPVQGAVRPVQRAAAQRAYAIPEAEAVDTPSIAPRPAATAPWRRAAG